MTNTLVLIVVTVGYLIFMNTALLGTYSYSILYKLFFYLKLGSPAIFV
jgi:hypothetical protein